MEWVCFDKPLYRFILVFLLSLCLLLARPVQAAKFKATRYVVNQLEKVGESSLSEQLENLKLKDSVTAEDLKKAGDMVGSRTETAKVTPIATVEINSDALREEEHSGELQYFSVFTPLTGQVQVDAAPQYPLIRVPIYGTVSQISYGAATAPLPTYKRTWHSVNGLTPSWNLPHMHQVDKNGCNRIMAAFAKRPEATGYQVLLEQSSKQLVKLRKSKAKALPSLTELRLSHVLEVVISSVSEAATTKEKNPLVSVTKKAKEIGSILDNHFVIDDMVGRSLSNVTALFIHIKGSSSSEKETLPVTLINTKRISRSSPDISSLTGKKGASDELDILHAKDQYVHIGFEYEANSVVGASKEIRWDILEGKEVYLQLTESEAQRKERLKDKVVAQYNAGYYAKFGSGVSVVVSEDSSGQHAVSLGNTSKMLYGKK